jgi:recombinational DNA repair protein (RecF pathway)
MDNNRSFVVLLTSDCARCHQPEPDSSQRWPDGDGYLCQDCWEGVTAAAWWHVAEATTRAAEAGGNDG